MATIADYAVGLSDLLEGDGGIVRQGCARTMCVAVVKLIAERAGAQPQSRQG